MIRSIKTSYDVIRDGVTLTELEAVGRGPEIKMQEDAEIKTSLSGTFRFSEDVDFLTDRLRPYIRIGDEWFPLGEYVVTTADVTQENGEKVFDVEAYDQGVILKQVKIETRPSFVKGDRYTDVIRSCLAACGITNVLCQESAATLQTDREDWEIGTSYLEIVNQLLAEINFHSLWFDAGGAARIGARNEVDTDRIDHVYRSGEYSLVRGNLRSSEDTYEAYNVFIAEVENPDMEEPIRAMAANEDPTNPLSTVRRGRRILAPVVKLDNIASADDLQRYVDRIRNQSLRGTEEIEFTTAISPGHGCGDFVALELPEMRGIYQETAWSFVIDAADTMKHTAKKVMNF